MNISLIAIGKMKSGLMQDLFKLYRQRLIKDISLKEIDLKVKGSVEEIKNLEAKAILEMLPSHSFVILLDEKGQEISSMMLAQKLQRISYDKIIFIIGGAWGVASEVRARASLIVSFGRLTWPHMLVRILLMEQIYRVQQIHSHHPYHKE